MTETVKGPVLSQENRERQIELARRMAYIDLSIKPDYVDEHIGGFSLPDTDGSRYPDGKAENSVRGSPAAIFFVL